MSQNEKTETTTTEADKDGKGFNVAVKTGLKGGHYQEHFEYHPHHPHHPVYEPRYHHRGW